MKTTTKILYDKGLFGNYDNMDEITDDFLLSEKRRPDLEKVNDVHL